MRKLNILILYIFISIATALACKQTVLVSNSNDIFVANAPVVIELDKLKKIPINKRHQLAVFINNQEVSSQLDDLDGDGIFDEIVFLADFQPKETKTIVIKPIKDKKRSHFPKEVYTSLLLKNKDGTFTPTKEVWSDKDNMYNKLHHHGVAFESDLIAYRIYFDNKSTIDVYGKKIYQLEIGDTKWYPTEEQLSQGYGDDILLVADWVGVGTVKGFENQLMTHIKQFAKRTQRIVAEGNVRTVVESEVQGWEYEGHKTDITVRYILYANHRDVIAEIRSSHDIQSLATGVQQVGGGSLYHDNQLVGSWGSWFPQPDTIKYAKETVGLGLHIPTMYNANHSVDGVNNLLTFSLKKIEPMRFYFTVIATKEEQNTVTSSSEFFDYLNKWVKTLQPIEVGY